jgi:hypothetical protein
VKDRVKDKGEMGAKSLLYDPLKYPAPEFSLEVLLAPCIPAAGLLIEAACFPIKRIKCHRISIFCWCYSFR